MSYANASQDGPGLRPVRVLTIEDNAIDRDLFRRLLGQSRIGSFDCFECDQGRAAIDQLRKVRPDCVLLDLNLPDMNGLEVLRSIIEEPDTCPVIVMTAYGSEEIAVEAMKTGAADYLVKGTISTENLARVIVNAIEKRSLQQRIEEQRIAIEERNRQLELALERYRVLAEAMPQLVWTANPGGDWDYVNERWTELTGTPGLRAFGNGWLEFVDLQDREHMETVWRAAVANTKPVESECRFRSGDVSRWQLMRAVPLLENGSAVKWVGTFTDVEDQRRTEQLLHQRQKLDSIGILAGGVAHDFNNLLVGIVGGVSYALDMLSPNHELQPILNGALRSGERAAELTRQLLAYAGKGNVLAVDVDLKDALHTTWDLLQASIPRSVDLKVAIGQDLPPVRTDPSQLQQVIMNLILNAAEAIPDGRQGIVIVRAEVQQVHALRSTWSGELLPGRYVVLDVRDNGAGIRPELLHRIFDPFFTTKFTGRGLGLAAVHGIVRSNHGLIEVESTLGRGTTFQVFLPAGSAVEKQRAGVSLDAAAPMPAAHILVVDDEAVVRNVAQTTLGRLGHIVHTALSGEEALEQIRAAPEFFSLVILDFNMPGLNGQQTFDAIRSIRSDLPVVICSGYSEIEIRARFENSSVAGFLQKPFRSETLRSAVSGLLTAS
jgi:PAS domain S-box-containing protein